jgi:hypothetical protein
VIHPGALWGTADPAALQVFQQVGGDPAALAGMLSLAINMYAELTGVLPARLGAQTVSHTTAFAKDAELQRGAVRTVDYVRQAGSGPLTRWLYMAYDMGREALGKEQISFYSDSYGGFIGNIDKAALPEKAAFEWFGAGGPAEEAQKKQMKMASAQQAVQLEMLRLQMGGQPKLDIDALQKQLLRDGGWTDLDTVFRTDTAGAEQPSNPGVAQAAIQQLLIPPGQAA